MQRHRLSGPRSPARFSLARKNQNNKKTTTVEGFPKKTTQKITRMKSNPTKVLPVGRNNNPAKLSYKKQSSRTGTSITKGMTKTKRGSRISEIEEAQKQELLKKIKEKDDRIAELLAKKEREKLLRKQQREADDLFHKSVLDKIKEEDERKRQETLQKILNKERRADELLRERELLALAGRLNAVEVRERLERIWKKTSRGGSSRSFIDKSDNAFRKKIRRRMQMQMQPHERNEEGENLETLSFEDLYMLMKAKSLDLSDMPTAINDFMDDVECTLRRTMSDGELELYGRNKDKYEALESELDDEEEDLMNMEEGRDENPAFRSEMIDKEGNLTQIQEARDIDSRYSVHQLSIRDEVGNLTDIEETRDADNGAIHLSNYDEEENIIRTTHREVRDMDTRSVHQLSVRDKDGNLSSVDESRDMDYVSDCLSTCAVDLDKNTPLIRDSVEWRSNTPSSKEDCEEQDEEEGYVLDLNEASDIDTVFSSLSLDLEKDMQILEEIVENENVDVDAARKSVYSWKMKTAFIMVAFSYLLNSGSEEEPSIMNIASLYYDSL